MGFHRNAPSLRTSPQWRRDFGKPGVKAGLPEDLVRDCGRHDYGIRILMRTGDLTAVMRTMGHKDVKTAMQYQHPVLEIVRATLDQDTAVQNRAQPD
jgi:site-specific recombinase XerC